MLQEHLGGYDHREMIELFGSFLVNSNLDPDGLRDGKTASFTVAHTSAGLYTVTLTGRMPIPTRLVYQDASISLPSTTIGVVSNVGIVEGSWDPSARTFQILCVTVGDVAGVGYADPAKADPIDNARIGFLLKGSISSSGTDAA